MKKWFKGILTSAMGFAMLFPSSAVFAADQIEPTDSIKEFLADQQASISFMYEDLTTGKQMVYLNGKVYPAASTIKLPLALYVYKLASEGKIDLDEKLTYHSYQYYGGTGIIQYQKVGSTYTIRELVKYAIEYSDNIAFIMLKERVGADQFIQYMRSIGGQVTYPNGQNLTTAQDMIKYLEALNEFTNEQPELGGELIYYLEHTIFYERIPAGIPNVDVAHKIGTLPTELVFHDVGIVYEDHPFLLAILSEGIPESQEGKVLSQLASLIDQEHKMLYDENVQILANNQLIAFPDAKPYVDHTVNRTIVPIRFVSEQLHAKVQWIPETQTVRVTKNGKEITVKIGSNQAYVNGQMVVLDSTPILWQGRVYVPLRFITEALGAKVVWEATTQTANLLLNE